MPRFQFRLKTLLRLREAARDERRAQLAEAFVAQRKLEDRRAELEQEVNAQKQVFRAGTAPGQIDVDLLLSANRYELVLRSEMHVLARHEADLAVEIDRRQQAVVLADREVKVLEKLRERQLEQFQQLQTQAEMKQIDEVAARVGSHEENS